jgi:PCFT/HCP family folate transporter-like MFS transporter 1/3
MFDDNAYNSQTHLYDNKTLIIQYCEKMTNEVDAEIDPEAKPSFPKWWRGLPSLLMMMVIANIDVLFLNDFIQYRYAQLYGLNNTSSERAREICLNESSSSPSIFSTTTTPKYPISTTPSFSDLVQSSTARLNVYIYLAATLPAIITSMIVGANCDRTGRKSLIALPFIGKMLRYVLLTAVAFYDLPDWCIVVSVMFDGLCGAQSLCILSAFAYVADCTTVKSRTPATIITNISIAASRILPLVTLGFYLQSRHYTIPMLIGLGLSIFGFIFTLFFQPESNVKARRLNIFQQLGQIHFGPVKNILTVYLIKREGNKQRRLLINVATHLGFIVMLCGHVAVFFLYLYGSPFCFDSFNVGIITVVQIGTAVVLTIPFTLTVAKRTDHLFIPMLGILSYMTQFILLGITDEVWLLYLAVCIGAIFFVTSPIIRSRISKLVEPTEYAVVFILASIFESAGYYAISAGSNEIYRLSLSFDSGLIFFVLAFIGLLPLSLMIYLHVIEHRSRRTPALVVNINE